MKNSLPPIRHSIEVSVPPDRAFRIFTESMDSWWPLATHSIDSGRVTGCVFEGAEGGRIFETLDDGTIRLWGTVTTWDPPTYMVFSWHPGRAEHTAQEVELRFTPKGQGTLVELEQRGWEVLGDQAAVDTEGLRDGLDPRACEVRRPLHRRTRDRRSGSSNRLRVPRPSLFSRCLLDGDGEKLHRHRAGDQLDEPRADPRHLGFHQIAVPVDL